MGYDPVHTRSRNSTIRACKSSIFPTSSWISCCGCFTSGLDPEGSFYI